MKPFFIALTIILILFTRARFTKSTILLAVFGITTFLAYTTNNNCQQIAYQSKLLWSIAVFIFIMDFLSYKKNQKKQNMIKAMLLIFILYLVFLVLSNFLDNSLIFGISFAFVNPEFNVPLYYHPQILGSLLSLGLVLITFQIKIGTHRMMYTLFFILTALMMLHLSPFFGLLLLIINTVLLLKYGYGFCNVKSVLFAVLLTILISGTYSIMFEDVISSWQECIGLRSQKFFRGVEVFTQNPITGGGGDSFGVLSKRLKGKSIFLSTSQSKNFSNSNNLFLEIAIVYGVIAFIALLFFLLTIFQRGRKYGIPFIINTVIIFIICGLSENLFCNYNYQLFLLIILAVYLSDIEDKKIISSVSSKVFIYIFLFASFGIFILDSGNKWGSFLWKEALKTGNPVLIKAGLERALDFSPMNSEIYNDLAEISILTKKYDEAQENLSKALQYSRLNLRSMQYSCWLNFMKHENSSEIVEKCRDTDPFDEYGLIDMFDCQISFSLNKFKKSAVGMFFYLLRYPEFWNDIFLKMNPILKESVKKIIYSKKVCFDTMNSFGAKGFFILRLSEIYFFAGDYSEAVKLFRTIDPLESDSWNIDDKSQIILNFKKEYKIMKIRLGLCSEKELNNISNSEDFEILNSLLIYLYRIKKFKKVINVADKFLESGKIGINQNAMHRINNDGMYSAVLCAIILKNEVKAEEFSDFLLNIKKSRFLGHLSKAHLYVFLNKKKLALNELNKFFIAVSSKKHTFQKNRILNLFLELNNLWIKDRKFPIGLYNYSRYVTDMEGVYEVLLKDKSINLDLEEIRSFFAPLLKSY